MGSITVRIFLIILFALVVLKVGLKFHNNITAPPFEPRMIKSSGIIHESETYLQKDIYEFRFPDGLKVYVSDKPVSQIIEDHINKYKKISAKIKRKDFHLLSFLTIQKENGDFEIIFGYPAQEKGKWIVWEKKNFNTIEGYLTEEQARIWDDICKNIPNYPGAVCRLFMNREPLGLIAMLSSDSSISVINNFYRKEMLKKNWKLVRDTANTQIYLKNDVLCALSIAENPDKKGSKIGVVISK